VRIDRSDDGASHPANADRPAIHGTDVPATKAAADSGEPALREPDAEKRVTLALENRAKVDADYRAYAIDQGYERVREIEGNIVTPAMQRIAAADPSRRLAGLEHRLKGKERLAEKVEFDVQKKSRTVEQAFDNVKDAIRYTFVYDEAKYASGVSTDCERIAAEGFQLIERPNSWKKEQYKGINSRWRSSDTGQLFEVQFHTQASLDAKEETHWAYERLRVGVPTAAAQKELEEYQKQVTARIPIPPGAAEIPNYP
jgi:hypothetical protein